MRFMFPSSALLSSALIVLSLGQAAAQTNEKPGRPSLSFGNPGFAAPGTDGPGQPPSPRPNQADHVFLMQAALGGLAEVRLAQLADQKSGNDDVRGFARRMIQSHSQANNELSKLVPGGNTSGQSLSDAEDRQVFSGLAALSGPEFDIEYLRVQVQAHQRMAQLAEYEIGSGADPNAQLFAADMLPNIFAHLLAARELLQRISAQNPQISAAPPRVVSGMPTPQTPRAISN